jgi:hypothetical protein
MKAPSPTSEPGRGHRLLVTIVITTAAAAVTAGVALNERQPGERIVQRAEASPALAAATNATPAADRHARLSETASTSTADLADVAVGVPSDRSLPAASDALKGVTGSVGEPAPTF